MIGGGDPQESDRVMMHTYLGGPSSPREKNAIINPAIVLALALLAPHKRISGKKERKKKQ